LHQVSAHLNGVKLSPPELPEHSDVAERPDLDEEHDERVSKPVVYGHVSGPARIIIEVTEMDIVIVLLHDDTGLIGELSPVLPVKLVLGEVGFGLDDLWIFSTTWKDDVISP
jgi:hypothetical protein